MSPKLEPKLERFVSYHDGELDDAARAEFEAELALDAGLAAELRQLERMRTLLAQVPEALAIPDPGELVFERIRQSVHASVRPAAVDAESIAPGVSPAASATSATSASKPAVIAPVVPIGSARRSRAWAVFATVGVAAAAAVAVVVARPHTVGDRSAHGTEVHDSQQANANSLNGTEIVRVEFGKMSGTYWEQSEGADRVAIVWIDDSVLEEVGRP